MTRGINPLSIRTGKSGDLASPPRRDDTDYAHRHFVNLAATAVLLAVGFAIIWTVLAIDRYEAHERCLASGRLDCVRLVEPVRGVSPLLTHPQSR